MQVDRGAIDAQSREIGEGERCGEQREFAFFEDLLQKRIDEASLLRGSVDS